MKKQATEIGGEAPTNGAAEAIAASAPYVATATLTGAADMLFHRWNCDAVEAKGNAPKGSKAKKTDDIESYVYRSDRGRLCLPGEYVRQAIIHAAKFRQDPRSPRKSAMDLYKAGVVTLTPLAAIRNADGRDLETWDYEHKCRVQVQRSGITRTRPAIKAGWEAQVQLCVLLPEYIRPADLQDVLTNAGRLVGLADFRPTYGRFQVTGFKVGLDESGAAAAA